MILAAISAIATITTTIVKIAVTIGMTLEGIKMVTNVFGKILKSIGLVKSEPEELGDKAIQSELKPEDFQTYKAYVEEVEKQKLDPEMSKKISPEDKYLKALELHTGLLVEEYGKEAGELVKIILKNSDIINNSGNERVKEYLDSGNLKEINDFLSRKDASGDARDLTFEKLVNIEQKINPDITRDNAEKAVSRFS